MMDLTSRNLSQWLLKTRDDFYKRRYGGFEFGVKSPFTNIDLENLKTIFSTLDRASNLGEDRLNFIESGFLFNRIGQALDIYIQTLYNLGIFRKSVQGGREGPI